MFKSIISTLHYMMLIIAFIIGLAFVRPGICADANFSNGFAMGVDTAKALKDKSINAMTQFHPETFLKNYSTNPNETQYFNNTDQLTSDATNTKGNSEVGKSLVNGMKNRGSQFNYSIDTTSEAIQKIERQANNIYDVLTNEFSDCTKESKCNVSYEEHTCEEAPRKSIKYCQKILIVDMVPRQVETHYYLNAKINVNDHDYAGVNVNVLTGKPNFIGPHDANFSLSGSLPKGVDCHSLSGKITSSEVHAKIDSLDFPSCENGLTLSIHMSGGHSIDLKIDMTSTKIEYDPQDKWQDDCATFQNNTLCKIQDEHCVSKDATKVVQDIPVYRACWEKEVSYSCEDAINTQDCQSYRDKGCQAVGSICETRSDSGCLLFKQTFQCPIKQCEDVGLMCNGETYCLTGECVKQQKQPDPDFQKSITGLSAVNDAVKSYSKNPGSQFPIFSGQVKTCNKDFIDFANCCSDDGWGVDLHLAQCDPESKELGEAKQKGLTVYIDSQNDCILGMCSHKKKYCVFPSKLARIIQENGRRDQLNISFGSYDDPDCRGLTPEQFGNLNLKQMDFSEVYADITKNVHVQDKEQISQRITIMSKKLAKENSSHG